jgi:hypothetical protein
LVLSGEVRDRRVAGLEQRLGAEANQSRTLRSFIRYSLLASRPCQIMLRGVSKLSQIAEKRESAIMPVASTCWSVFFWPGQL